MKLKEIINELEVQETNISQDLEISDICYDSRKVQKGDLFVAIRGFQSDGHKYINSAIKLGAAAIICEEKPEENVPYILVENSRLALSICSMNYFKRPSDDMVMIGITGTNGKTTTTMLIKHVIEKITGAKVGLIGTNQNMIGEEVLETERTTPESYELQKLFREMADKSCKYVVMEVSSHSLALDRVGNLRFNVSVFTNLTQDHLDFHETMEEYAGAKGLLFQRSDKCVINLDDEWSGYMMAQSRGEVLSYSEEHLSADFLAKDLRLSPKGVKFLVLHDGSLVRCSIGIPARFSIYNALAVISACSALGFDLRDISAALADAKGVKGRVELVPTPDDFTILIDYAHTPDALENVITSVKEVASGRVITLFGCGGDRDSSKRPLMGEIAVANSDFSIITSDNPRTENPSMIIKEIVKGIRGNKSKYTVIEDRRKAIKFAIDNHLKDDVIILAGKGHETYQIIGTEKTHMDEREIVAECLKK